jgi:penicillin-binding protein 2
MRRSRIPADWEVARLHILLGIMWLGLALLGAAVWRVQIVHGTRFEKDLDRQSIRRVRQPALRGRILDRHGAVLAENRPCYDLVLYLDEVRRAVRRGNTLNEAERILETLSRRLALPRELTREQLRTHMDKRLPLPLTAWSDLDETAVARWAEQANDLPGVELQITARRFYPNGPLAAHVLGYTGRIEIPDQEPEPVERFHYYLPDTEGRTGVERVFDAVLRGEAGGSMVRVDVAGFRHEEIGGREPVPGRDIVLSMDLRIQQAAEDALGDTPGAVAVLDPRNGDVLALASAPGFNPNDFIPAISSAMWRALREDPGQPLFPRATSGAYPPGSIFKPITALAALDSGRIVPGTRYSCPGYFQLGRATFRCWEHAGHGDLHLRAAIRYSCNVYFFRAALAAGHEAVARWAREFGLGARTGISLDTETAGIVPDDAWKRARFGDGWRDGDTCNLSIGQGALLVSPLQMAVTTAALANGGIVYPPNLLRSLPPDRDGPGIGADPAHGRRLAISPAHLREVREGMREVVMAPDGTGRRARVPGSEVAGKTGTAEYGRKDEGKKRGWMIAFAPFEAPRFAVAMMVEDADSGGTTVAPRMQFLLSTLLDAAVAAPGAEVRL